MRRFFKDRNILSYWLYSGTPASFNLPIHFLFLKEVGIHIDTILFLKSFGYTLTSLLELPLGFLSDRIRRRWILAGSSFLSIFAQLLYLTSNANRLPLLFLAETLSVISTCLYTGTKSSIIADHLEGKKELHEFGIVQSIALAITRASSFAFVGVGGLLYLTDKRLPFAANILILLLGGFLILRFQDRPVQIVQLSKYSFSQFTKFISLWPLVLLSGFVSAAFTLLSIFMQPFLQDIYGMRADSISAFYQVYSFAAVLGGFLVIPALKNRRNLLIISSIVWTIGLGFLLLSLKLNLLGALALFLILRIIHGLQNLFFQNEVHRFARNSSRATLLSLVNVTENLIRAVILLASAQFVSNAQPDLRKVLLCVGITYIASFVPMIMLSRAFYKRESKLLAYG